MLLYRCCMRERGRRGYHRMYDGIDRREIGLMLLMPCTVQDGSSHVPPGGLSIALESRELVDGEGC